MENNEERSRINIDIPIPSVSLKRFVEKVVQDDSFFSFALENPLGAMKENGVNLEVSSFIPSDFADFFGVLAGLKEWAKEKNIEDLTFEGIFGRAAVVRGATLIAAVTRGFFQEWATQIQAASDRESCFSSSQSFEVVRGRSASSVKDLCRSEAINISMVGSRSESRETSVGQNKSWDTDTVAYRRSESYRTVNKSFEAEGIRSLEDLLSGPLIYPEDLASLSARIESHIKYR